MDYDSLLSPETKALWGKLSDREGRREWLPLYIHMWDAAEVAGFIWDNWLPEGTKTIIVQGIEFPLDFNGNKPDYARKASIFLACSHDIAKASPSFSAKAISAGFECICSQIEAVGLPLNGSNTKAVIPHAFLSQKILENHGVHRSCAVIVGGHHGKPPNEDNEIDTLGCRSVETGIGMTEWDKVHSELINFALGHAGLDCVPQEIISIGAQIILTGLLIMADWIASGDGFPLFSVDFLHRTPEPERERALDAWDELRLTSLWNLSDAWKRDDLYKKRFQIQGARPVQESVAALISIAEDPGIVVIEAPMGEGKTEAALVAAEIMAAKHKKAGVYFALPTQATSDGIFRRINRWVEQFVNEDRESKSIFLAHGKAGFNKDYEGIKIRSNIRNYEEFGNNREIFIEREDVIVNEWTSGKKKGLLSDFVVGTIDQILMCGLKQKHLALRHLGIANKVVIIDECHAYDIYMSSYLLLTLKWLGMYRVPIVILSATLPSSKRRDLIEAYVSGIDDATPGWETCEEYPLITWSDGRNVKQKSTGKSGRKQRVEIKQLEDALLAQTLDDLLQDGGCAGIIRNTVHSAQETARQLREHFRGRVEISLIHSRFISNDRVLREQYIRDLLGPPDVVPEEKRPKCLIVIGSQILEQSLDYDLDVLFTDFCPLDLFLQRLGRLHRHFRSHSRPEKCSTAVCYVMGIQSTTSFDEGSEAVYGKYLLMKSLALLPSEIQLPEDISRLVQMTYEDRYENCVLANLLQMSKNPELVKREFEDAKNESVKIDNKKKNRAKSFQIDFPDFRASKGDLVGWLKADVDTRDSSGKRGEAAVRDIDGSLEVLVLRKKKNGRIYSLPWISGYGDRELGTGELGDGFAKAIAGCSVSLPNSFVKPYIIDSVISELETVVQDNHLWELYASHWLAGELFLVLDENYQTSLHGHILTYTKEFGLQVEKEERDEGS